MFNIKKIIIVIIVVALAFVGYGFLISGNKQESASGVTKQAVTTTSGSGAPTNAGALDGPGKEFVTQLLAIQNIKFNLQLFEDPVFQGLQDWSREILPQETGRPNPFAPLENDMSTQVSDESSFSGNIGSVTLNSTEIATSSESSKAQSKTTPSRTTNTKSR
jgi:hypothetical protein